MSAPSTICITKRPLLVLVPDCPGMVFRQNALVVRTIFPAVGTAACAILDRSGGCRSLEGFHLVRWSLGHMLAFGLCISPRHEIVSLHSPDSTTHLPHFQLQDLLGPASSHVVKTSYCAIPQSNYFRKASYTSRSWTWYREMGRRDVAPSPSGCRTFARIWCTGAGGLSQRISRSKFLGAKWTLIRHCEKCRAW